MLGGNMRHIVAGTAGHVDHGKTALIRALTGIDTDRLEEEKRRGISIDLGFAYMDLAPDLRVSFIDVPGHERFVKNMLAGVAGIDLVLLVVAADESVKPQTREHFDICRLLGIRHGIVVLTKCDLVPPDVLDLVKLEVEEFTRGSFLEGAPVAAVSSVTGEGIDRLRELLAAAAARLPVRDSTRPFRLPIDRAFIMKGFGAVVTGTLVSGKVRVEEEVEIHGLGRRARVRGIEVHGHRVEEALAGQRTALNLAGVEARELRRGMVLTHPGLFQTTREADARFSLLPSAKPLKHRAPVHFHAGAAEVVAEVRLLDGRTVMEPGAEGYVRLKLAEPLLLLPGDRFIARMFSPVVTIGGGTILDIAPPRVKQPAERLKRLDGAAASEVLATLVRESRHGCSLAELIRRTGLTAGEIRDAGLTCLPGAEAWFVDAEWLAALRSRILEELKNFHAANPLQTGMPKEELRNRLLPGAPAFLLDSVLANWESVAADGDRVRLSSHKVAYRGDEEEALQRIENAFEAAGFNAPGVGGVLAGCGVEASRARQLLQILLRSRRLIRVSEDLVIHVSAATRLKEMLAPRRGQRFTVAEFKEWTGVSRKFAIPLLEFLDRERVTRREGDQRVIL